ncbi:hypothetical protein Pla175_15280 [Pirellulimonas nuda]|uniref:Rhomboid family protein n=1 Tax=Pirellulimonas nuda TaxID=2528009 RepID=A0A518D9I8_9BACT|nr:rhomboid family intramembrane serine protease [Pirellulimonas nuda]QDU88157.1 hypothetical protein Pla175_15280 [Pirellulimonas nuda]
MSWQSQLERRLSWLAVPNVVPAIVVAQVLVYLIDKTQAGQGPAMNVGAKIALLPDRVLQGEWWRVVTFLFEPTGGMLIWQAFTWLLLWSFAGAIERAWGTVSLNLYLIVGYVATVAVAFVIPEGRATNVYLYTSLFLAFAQLYPDTVFYIYFVLPVKAKWLAALTWLFFALRVYSGGWPEALLVLATVADFLLFFSLDLFRSVGHARRKQKFKKLSEQGADRLTHECRVCGLTSQMAPKASFRYCTKCAGTACYCPEHLHKHEHLVATDEA